MTLSMLLGFVVAAELLSAGLLLDDELAPAAVDCVIYILLLFELLSFYYGICCSPGLF